MNKDIIKFLTRTLYTLLPFIPLIMMYLYFDPFRVVRDYPSFYEDGQPFTVALDRDYVSTATFDRYYSDYTHDSFIFGNSRSIFYEVKDWKRYIGDSASCYHFDASGEALYALHKKVIYLDKRGVDIRNVLLVLDNGTLYKTTPHSGHLYFLSPQLVDYKNAMKFHAEFLHTFLRANFMAAYLDYKISGQIKPYMKREGYLDDRICSYDLPSNEMRFADFERQIAEGKFYTEEKIAHFRKRDTVQRHSPAVIKAPQLKLLTEISEIFKKHDTDCRVIISPLYDQVKFNADDLASLKTLFGEDRVFDFSGINYITNDYHNYYEGSHYRPTVGAEIMRVIYN